MFGHSIHNLSEVIGADDDADISQLVTVDVFVGTSQSGFSKSLMHVLDTRSTNCSVHVFVHQELESYAVVAQLDYELDNWTEHRLRIRISKYR